VVGVSERATAHVLEYIEGKTEPEVDGLQDNQAAVWTGANHLKAQARKDRVDFDVNELEVALEELREAGEIVTWHGLVTLASDEHLETIIENEVQSDITRGILVGRCNRLLAGKEVTYRVN